MCPPDEELSAYVDGELSLEARSALAEHLKDCPQCRERAEGLERARAVIRQVFRQAADEICVLGMVPDSTPPRTRRRWRLVRVAAAAAVLVAVTLCAFRVADRGQSGPPPLPRTPQEVSSTQEERVILFNPSVIPLRAQTLSLALAGDLDAQIQLCRLGLSGSLLRADGKPSWPSAAVPTVEEMLADRQRSAALAQRVMGAER